MKKATVFILVLALVLALVPAASAEELKLGDYNLVLKTDFSDFTSEQFFGYTDTLTNVELVDTDGGGKAVKVTSNEDKVALHTTAGITEQGWDAKTRGMAVKVKTGDSYVAFIPKVVFQVQPEGFDEPARYGVFALYLGENFYLYDAEGKKIDDYDDFEGGPGFPGAPGVYLPDNFDGYLVFDFVDVFFEDINNVGIEDPAEIDWSTIHHMVFFIGNGDDITVPMENTEITFEGIYALTDNEPAVTDEPTESPTTSPEQSPQASTETSPAASPEQTASKQPAASDDGKEDDGISTGAIIGIIAGVLVIAGVAIFFVMRKKPADKPEENSDK